MTTYEKEDITEIKKIDGSAEVTYKDGSIYVGMWDDDYMRHGTGIMKYPTKEYDDDFDVLHASWVNNKCEDGYAKYMWADGSCFIGTIENERRNGYGSLDDREHKFKYIGDFVNGLRHGNGKIVYDCGKVYEGEWENDKKTGYGTITFQNKNTYTGMFLRDKKHGKGKYMWADGKEWYDGNWEKDRMNGYGTYQYANGDKYQGEMKNDDEHGYGIFTYENYGHTYEGDFKCGLRSGQGIMYYYNGDVYDGLWKSDKRNGLGKLLYEDESYYVGTWENNKRTGLGQLCSSPIYQADGEIYRDVTIGIWNNDEQLGRSMNYYE